MPNPVAALRIVALIEGVSYILLCGIAMPLKYIWHEPMLIRPLGMAHGVLFVAFCAALLASFLQRKWSIAFAALVFVSSLLPFGTFFMDKKLKALAHAPTA